METTGVNEIQELAKHWEVLVTVLIVGLVQVLKAALPTFPARFIPLLNLTLGVGSMLVLAGQTIDAGVAGMLIGFAASGIYSSGKSVKG